MIDPRADAQAPDEERAKMTFAEYLALSTDGCRTVDAGLWDCCGVARLRDGGCGALPSY